MNACWNWVKACRGAQELKMLQWSIVSQRPSNFNVNTVSCWSETEILMWIPYVISIKILLKFVMDLSLYCVSRLMCTVWGVCSLEEVLYEPWAKQVLMKIFVCWLVCLWRNKPRSRIWAKLLFVWHDIFSHSKAYAIKLYLCVKNSWIHNQRARCCILCWQWWWFSWLQKDCVQIVYCLC